jgi:hypothetical protein
MKTGLILFLSSLFLFSSCYRHSGIRERKPFDETHIPPAPDYSKTENWAALPTKKDMADSLPSGAGLMDKQAGAKVDVFFIHPTSYLKTTKLSRQWNADVNDPVVNKKTDEGGILYQASIFNGSGKIYAPRYRQAILQCYFTKNKNAADKALALAYSDVKRAFEFYLEHYNQGRPIIIAAHSQGSTQAKKLLQEFFDGKPLEKQLVAAYMVGMDIYDTLYVSLRPCSDADQTGCYVSWRTFAKGYSSAGIRNSSKAVCTNPLSWTMNPAPAGAELNKGGVLKDFRKIVPGLSDAQISEGVVKVDPHFRGNKLLKNYHILDYDLFYLNIRENVEHRMERYIELQKK